MIINTDGNKINSIGMPSNEDEINFENSAAKLMEEYFWKKAYFEAGLAWAKSKKGIETIMGDDRGADPDHIALLYPDRSIALRSIKYSRMLILGQEWTEYEEILSGSSVTQDPEYKNIVQYDLEHSLAVALAGHVTQWFYEDTKDKKPLLLDLQEPDFMLPCRLFRYLDKEKDPINFNFFVTSTTIELIKLVEKNWDAIDCIAKEILRRGTLKMETVNNLCKSRKHIKSVQLPKAKCLQSLVILCPSKL